MPEEDQPMPTPFDPAFALRSSVQTDGQTDYDNGQGNMAMNILRNVLVGLREGATIIGISYIAPVATLLLRTAKIQDNMKRFTGDWAVVMDKLQKVTYLLNNLGNWCALHNLEERNLPPSLRQLFNALRTGLDELTCELEQIKEQRSYIQCIISPKDTRQMVMQCDAKLTNLLQTFELALNIDSRLQQVKYYYQRDSLCN